MFITNNNKMEKKEKLSFETFGNKVMRRLALFISSMVLFAYSAMADDSGPSLGNLNKNLTAAKDEMSYQEKLNYFYMAAGFTLVMCIAWFSTTLAKKRKLE